MAKERYTLRLPVWLRYRFSVELLLARLPGSWSKARELIEAFALSEPEKRFVRELLRRKSNYWIYRCNQRLFCGDFILVDMSVPEPADRRVKVLELKQSGPVRVSPPGESAGIQMRNASLAVDELRSYGIIAGAEKTFQCMQGEQNAILAQLAGHP